MYSWEAKFVNRNNELSLLNDRLDSAFSLQGKTVLLFGESGIGKTRLAVEFLQNAKDCTMLIGECYANISEPYHAFQTALKKLTDEELAPREKEKLAYIDEIFIINKAGMLLAHEFRGMRITEKDEDIFAGMFTAVNDFVRDSFGATTPGALGILGYGDKKVLLEHGKYGFLAGVTTEETREIRNDLRTLINMIDIGFGKILESWDGDVSRIADIKNYLQPILKKEYIVERRIDKTILDSEQIKTYERFLTHVEKEAQQRAVIIFIDNLQFADSGTLGMLHYISRNIRKSRILLLGTYRTEDIAIYREVHKKEHPLIETLRGMQREQLYEDLEVGRLSEKDVSEITFSLYPELECDEKFISKIYSESEGNPLYAEFLLKALESEGIIYKREGKWYARSIDRVILPKNIKELVLARVSKLSELQKKIIDCCSVIGEKFSYEVLRNALEIKEEELVYELEILTKMRFLREIPNTEIIYKFDHCKIQECIYDELGGALKKLLHRKVAESYEKSYKNIEPYAGETAIHYYRAGNYEKALDYGIIGGRYAFSKHLPQDAEKYYQTSLSAIEKLESNLENKNTKLEIVNSIGYANFILGNWDKALQYAEESIKLASETANIRQLIETEKNTAEIYIGKAEYSASEETLRKAIAVAESINELMSAGECYRLLGKMYWRIGKLDNATEILNKALQISKKIDDKSIYGKTLMDIGIVHSLRGEYSKSIELYMKSLEIAEKLNDKYEIGKAYNNIGVSYGQINDTDTAIFWYEKCIKISTEIGFLRFVGYGVVNAGEEYAKKGNLEKALKYTDKAVQIFEKLGEKRMIGACHGNYGIVYTKMKDYATAEKHFQIAVKIITEIEDFDELAQTYHDFGRMYKGSGDIERERKMFEKAIESYRKLGNEKKIEEIKKEMEGL